MNNIFNDQNFIKRAIIRVNELQNEVIQKANLIDGSDKFVKKYMDIFYKKQKLNK